MKGNSKVKVLDFDDNFEKSVFIGQCSDQGEQIPRSLTSKETVTQSKGYFSRKTTIPFSVLTYFISVYRQRRCS